MSDGILSGLRAEVPDKSYALDELTGTQAYEWALNDVREALRSKHTRSLIAMTIADWVAADPDQGWDGLADEIVAALAGGDQ